MKNSVLLLVAAVFFHAVTASYSENGSALSPAGTSSLEFCLNPGLTIPLGDSMKIFSFGSGNMLSCGYVLGYSPSFFFGAEIGYNFTPLTSVSTISLFSGGGRAGASIRVLPTLEAGVFAGGGYFYGFLNGNYEYGGNTYSPRGGNPYFSGGARIAWYPVRNLGIGLEGVYRNYLGFSHDASAGLGITYHIPFESIEALEDKGINIEPVFPVLMTDYYTSSQLGKVTLRNKAELPVSKLRVSFFVNGYMDKPAELKGESGLAAGASSAYHIFAGFAERALDFKDERTLRAEITAEYEYSGQSALQRFEAEIKFKKYTDFAWLEPEYICSYVTPRAQGVTEFAAKAVESIKEKANKEIPMNIQRVIAFQNALSSMKLAFKQDQGTPYRDYSQDPRLSDSIQLPDATLARLSGDSDELSLLYASLLETSGVETALIQVPGQMMIAFAPGIKEADIALKFFHAEKLIISAGNVWLPFDVTEQTGSFINAVTAGSDKWVKAKTNARMYPVASTHAKHKPLSPVEGAAPSKFPDQAELLNLFASSIESFIFWEMDSKAKEVRAQIARTGSSSPLLNRLGVLYGRYGLYDKALEIFLQVLLKDEYVPSLVNTGNIYYKQNELNKSLPFYERAYKQAPLDAYTLLGLAKINHKLENYGNAREAYNKLKSIEPALAERYSYLELKGDEARLAAKLSEEKEEVVWILE